MKFTIKNIVDKAKESQVEEEAKAPSSKKPVRNKEAHSYRDAYKESLLKSKRDS